MKVRVRRLAHAADLGLPSAASGGSAGYDLRAALAEPHTLAPGERLLPGADERTAPVAKKLWGTPIRCVHRFVQHTPLSL